MVDFREFGKIDDSSAVLDKSIVSVKVNLALLHEVVRWQLAKRRLGTRKTKGISNIKATTRKPYKQKGTGKARQGSLCSPQFRGGAVIFGPVIRNHSFSLNKKVCKLAIKMALSEKIRQSELLVIRDEQLSDLKILEFANNPKRVSILAIVDVVRFRVNSNHYYVDVISCNAVNVYDIVRYDYVLLTHESVNYLNRRFV